MLDRKIVINELRKRGYIAEEKNVVKNGVLCDGISIHLPETKMENEKVQSVFGVIYMDTLEEMKEMENLSFEQVVERIIEVVWKNSPKLNDFPKNDKEVLKKITIGFQRTEYNSNMLKRKSDFDGIEEYTFQQCQNVSRKRKLIRQLRKENLMCLLQNTNITLKWLDKV